MLSTDESGHLAYGSLLLDAGEELEHLIDERVDGIVTPFNVDSRDRVGRAMMHPRWFP